MDQPVTYAAGVIAKAPTGRILMVKRTDTGEWAFPGGRLEGDETAAEAAYREFWEETQYRLGSVGMQLMQRRKDDGAGMVDFVTFIAPVESEFVPILDYEHSAFAWLDADEVFSENRAESLAIADSAEIETPPLLQDQGDEFEKDLDDPAPADDDLDDLDDETADLVLSVISDLEARLERLECDDDEPDPALDRESLARPETKPQPVHGASGAAELSKALDEGMTADWDD